MRHFRNTKMCRPNAPRSRSSAVQRSSVCGRCPSRIDGRSLVAKRLQETDQLRLAVRKKRRYLQRAPQLIVRLIDQKSLRLGDRGLEQRAARRAHIHRIEIAAILAL